MAIKSVAKSVPASSPYAYGGSSPIYTPPKPVAVPKKKVVADPFGVPHVTTAGKPAYTLPPLSQSQPITSVVALPASLPVTQTTPASTGPTTGVPRSANPGNYLASLADIQAHPLWQQAQGQYNTDLQSLMRSLRSTLGQSAIKSGYDPTAAFQKLMADRPDLGEFSDLLSSTDLATATANPLSDRAQAEQGYNRGMSNLDYELAARGIQGSGAQATGGNQLLQARQLQENQSRAAFLDALQGGITNYLGQKTSGYNRLMDVGSQVAQLLAQQPGPVYEEPNTGDVEDVNRAGSAPIEDTNIPSAKTAPSNYLPWFGGQHITSVAQMKSELAKRGQSWNAWAKQYPAAAQRLLGFG